jgi:DNA-binding Xre family transcriptional regulator
MIKINIRPYAKARGYSNARTFADAMGASYNGSYKLWRGTIKRLDLSTIERVCYLLDITPGLMFEYFREPMNIKPRVIDKPKPKK